MTPAVSVHAKRAAESRGIPYGEVATIVAERAGDRLPARMGLAVFCGWAAGWRGASNGDEVWAVVRGSEIRTVFFRRAGQPATPEALRVAEVIR